MWRRGEWRPRRAGIRARPAEPGRPTMGTGYRSGTTWLEHAEHPDPLPLRVVEPRRLASLAAESAIVLARCLRDLPTAEAAFAAYE